jgi:branched-chain amino acid transport system substrate-binding protein
MNKKTRFLAFSLALIIIIVIGLIWCNQSTSMKQGDGIKVLAVLPLTGPASSLGEYIKNGIILYREDFPNSMLSIDIEDSTTNPQRAVSVIHQSAVTRTPDVVISALSSVTGAVIPKAEDLNLFVICINVSSEKIFKGRTNVQRINDRAGDISAPLAEYAARKYKTAAVVHSNEEFGDACKNSFVSLFTNFNGKIILVEPYDLKDINLLTMVQKVIEKAPEVVFVAGYGPAYLSIFQSLRTLRYKGHIMADINFSNPEIIKNLGDAAEGVIFTAMDINLSEPKTEKALLFIKKYKERFGNPPWIGASYVYDALSILEHFVKTKKSIRQETFRNLGTWKGVAGQLDFLDKGECQYHYIVIQRKEGKNVLIQQ